MNIRRPDTVRPVEPLVSHATPPGTEPRRPTAFEAYAALQAGAIDRIRRSEAAEPLDVRRQRGDVEGGEWGDPEDTNALRRTKSPRKIKGHMRACAVRRLYKRQGKSRLLSEQHVRAADLYRLQYDVGRLGYTPDPDQARGRRAGPKTGPSEAEHAQVDAQRCFERATSLIGMSWLGLVRFVILDGGDIKGWIVWHRALTGQHVRPDMALGILVFVLDRLVEHYGLQETDATDRENRLPLRFLSSVRESLT